MVGITMFATPAGHRSKKYFPSACAPSLPGKISPVLTRIPTDKNPVSGSNHQLYRQVSRLSGILILNCWPGIKPSDLMRTALHAELGKVTLAEMLNEWIGHDLMHTVQAERQ